MDALALSLTLLLFSVVLTTNTLGECGAAVTQGVVIQDNVLADNVVGGATIT